MVKVKICGIRRIEDAITALEAGADALGFVFAESKRKIEPEVVKTIIDKLPPFITTVGVFVNEKPDRVKEIARYCKLDVVQLHGDESPEYCKELKLKVIKGFRVKNEETIKDMVSYKDVVQGFLLDTYVSGIAGGTGETFEWSLALKAREIGPIILAGGLDSVNIAGAIEAVRPYAVDVSSGVETEGIKDATKIKAFLNAVRRANYDAR